MGALIARRAAPERRPDGAQGVVGTGSPVGERNTEELEFGLQRAHAHAQDDPAAAHDVEGAIALHHLEGVVVPEHEHVREQPDLRRRGGNVAERGERVPVAPAA